MQKTSNYNLKKPEPTDPLRVADFNENADKIDVALAAVPSFVTGTYTGNGTVDRTVDLGFTPKAVYVCGEQGATSYIDPSGPLLIYGGLAFPDFPVQHGGKKLFPLQVVAFR